MGNKIVDEAKKLSPEINEAIELGAAACPYIKGAIEAINMGESLITALGWLEEPENPLNKLDEKLVIIQGRLEDIYSQGEEQLKQVKNLETKFTRVQIKDKTIAIKESANDALIYAKNPTNSDNEFQFFLSRNDAKTFISQLRDNRDYWLRVYLGDAGPIDNEQFPGVYYDIWSDAIKPPLENGSGFVWDYRLALPCYLSAIELWFIILTASGKDFSDPRREETIAHINKLQSVLEDVLRGFKPIEAPDKRKLIQIITLISPGPWWEDRYWPANDQDKYINWHRLYGGNWILSKYIYGIIDIFTGIGYTDNYPKKEIAEGVAFVIPHYDDQPPTYPISYEELYENMPYYSGPPCKGGPQFDMFYDKFILMHTLRTLKQARKLSQELGLSNLLYIIREYCLIMNIPVFELQPELNRYIFLPSLKEFFKMIPESMKEPQNCTNISMKNIASIFGITPPISLRRMLMDT